MPVNSKNKNKSDTHRFKINLEQDGLRLDKVLAALCEDLSRARIQSLIQDGHVLVNGMEALGASAKVRVGSILEMTVPQAVAAEPEAENIPLDIVFEDEHLLVMNKPAGLVVHPGAGNREGTLVNALLHHCGESLSGIGGVMRPGIVHRLDKDTTGLLVVAKHDKAHQGLSDQLKDRTLSRVYLALVLKTPVPLKGQVEVPIGRHRTNRLKMAANTKGGKEARTFYHVQQDFGGACALVECKLESGRTHQIRVHMEFLGHPLIGDPLYGAQPTAFLSTFRKSGFEEEVIRQIQDFPRQALHAKEISFVHPVTEEEMSFEVPLPSDFSKLLNLIEKP